MKKSISRRIFSSPLYPRLPQALVLATFVYIILALIWGPRIAEDNVGSVLVWTLWWPLIPLTFILLGRIWCALCPWGAISDWVQSYFSFALPVPKWIKRYGIWVIFGGFMLLTWYELAFGLTSSGIATAAVLLIVLVLALSTSILFERRVWCRYLCPLGGIFGNYSQASITELRGTKEKCDSCNVALCYRGSEKAPGCALFEYPKVMDSNRLCNLCGDCVKSCPNDSPTLSLRLPGKELWEKRDTRLDESILASVLVGVILISGFGMLEFWQNLQQSVAGTSGISKPVFNTLAFVFFSLSALGVSMLASKISGLLSKQTTLQNFQSFGYALIPLNLMTHIAHNAFHFLGEGRNISNVIISTVDPKVAVAAAETSEHAAEANAGHGASSALVSTEYIQILQFILMGIGIAASIYVAYKIAEKIASDPLRKSKKGLWPVLVPHLFEISIFGAISFLMFLLPMAMRH